MLLDGLHGLSFIDVGGVGRRVRLAGVGFLGLRVIFFGLFTATGWKSDRRTIGRTSIK